MILTHVFHGTSSLLEYICLSLYEDESDCEFGINTVFMIIL